MSEKLQRIPKEIMRIVDDGRKKSLVETIIDYLTAEEGTVYLNDEQEYKLQRIYKIDELYSMNRYTKKELLNMHSKHFAQGFNASRQDLEDAGVVFGTAKKTNKRYRMAMHVDRIEDIVIKLMRTANYEQLAKMMDTLTKAIQALPEDSETAKQMPTIILNFTQNNVALTDVKEPDAMATAQAYFKAKGIDLDIPTFDEAEEVEDE
jgi:thioester reductase-like protein